MNLNKNTSRIFKFVLSLTMAMAICMGSFIDTNRIFKVNAAGPVATLTIHSDPTGGHWGLPTGQHSFISIRNKLKRNLNIFNYTIEPDHSMTIGTNPSVCGKGDGVYINAEAWLIKYKGYYKKRVSLSMDIDSAQLHTVMQTIRNFNNWSEYWNCSWFAESVWDSVAPTSLTVSCGTPPTPKHLADSIKLRKSHRIATQIGTCDKENVKRYYSSGQLSSAIDMRAVLRDAGVR